MISDELKNYLNLIMECIPQEEKQKPIYKTTKENNLKLFNLISEALKKNSDYFSVSGITKNIKGSMFLSSQENIKLAYITVTKNVVVHLDTIKKII